MDIAEMVQLLRTGVTRVRLRGTSVVTETHPPAWWRPQKHPFREILFVLAGENDFLLNDEVLHLQPGDAVPIDAWCTHPFQYPTADSGLVHCWIHLLQNHQLKAHVCTVGFHGDYHSRHEFSELPVYLSQMLMSRWNALLSLKNCETEAMAYLGSPIDCVLQEVAMRLLRRSRKSCSENLLAGIRLYVEARNGRDCSLRRLESDFGYSKYYLAHRFKQETGMSIGKFIDRVRLNFTRDAIDRGMTQKEISAELGFASPNAFWKWYHQR